MYSTGRERRRSRRLGCPTLSVAEAYRLLGLDPASDREQVRVVYRRLALQYHPDHNSGSEGLVHFKEIAAAYRVLQNKFRLDDALPDQMRAECERCGDYAVLHVGSDGLHCCAGCLCVAHRRPLLPAPPVTMVTCATTIVLLVLAFGSLAAGVWFGDGSYWMAALILGLLSLVSLAVTCATVIYTADPRPRSRPRQILRSSRGSAAPTAARMNPRHC